MTVGCGVAESRGGREGGTREHCLPQLHLLYVTLWSENLQHIHTQYSHMCNMYIQAHINMYCILIRAYYIQGWRAPKIRINHMSNVHDSVKQPAKNGGQLSLHVYLTYVYMYVHIMTTHTVADLRAGVSIEVVDDLGIMGAEEGPEGEGACGDPRDLSLLHAVPQQSPVETGVAV